MKRHHAYRLHLSLGLVLCLIAVCFTIVGFSSLAVAASTSASPPLSPGDLDPTFGNGGTRLTGFPVSVSSEAQDVARQSDGKLVVAGSSSNPSLGGGTNIALARYNPNGTLDTTFGEDGRVTTSFYSSQSSDDNANAVAITSDNKIVVVGTVEISGQRRFAVLRYLSDGGLDPSFGNGGQVVTTVGSDSGAHDLVLLSDNKIVVAGFVELSFGTTQDFALVRYMTDGTLDSSFDGDGIVTTDFDGTSDGANALAVLPDGKVVLAGTSISGGGSNWNFALARYNTDGSLDSSFGTGGKVVSDLGTINDVGQALALTPAGQILVVGATGTFSSPIFTLARYLVNGDLDEDFGTGGIVTTTFGVTTSYAYDVLILQDGRILAAGNASGTNGGDFALARFQSDGSPDATFGGDGQVLTNFGAGSLSTARALVLIPDGKALAVGPAYSVTQPGATDFALAGYLSNGDPDPLFGSAGDGKVLTSFSSSNAGAYALALQSDGKLVAAGPVTLNCSFSCNRQAFGLARYNHDGTLDPSFGTGGTITTYFTRGEAWAYGVAIQADGKIVAVGYAGGGTEGAFALARYLSDGTLDGSFGDGGRVITDASEFVRDAGFALKIQPDGKIVAAGYSPNGEGFTLIRYLSNGDLDTSFNSDGIVKTSINGNGGFALSLALQADGKIVAGGMTSRVCSGGGCTNEDYALVRYTPVGELDATFSGDGVVTTSLGPDRAGRIHGMVVQSDGKITVAGRAGLDCQDNQCNSSDFGLARYLPDGTLDNDFGTAGIVTTDFNGQFDLVFGLASQADGKLIAVGRASSSDFIALFGLARYLPDGNLDTTFGIGGKTTTLLSTRGAEANAVVLDADGKIVVAGEVRLDDGSATFALARYLVSGDPVPTPTTDPATNTPQPTSTSTPASTATPLLTNTPQPSSTSAPQLSSTPTATVTLPTATPSHTPDPASCVPGQFSDVPSDSTFYPFVTCLVNRGIVSGYADCTFRPNNQVTRGQLAKIVSNSAGFSEDPNPQIFEDVPTTNPFYEWINRLARRGHMSGYTCGGPNEPCGSSNRPYFRPASDATRGQTSKIVSNAASYSDPQTEQSFEDVPITHPFYLWIQRLAGRGIMGGYVCGGVGEPCGAGNLPYFRPSNNVTRGQSAKIVANTFYPGCQP